MSTVVKDLGAVSAYAYAVEKGYTGTEAEFAELMADYADVGQRAEDAAESALNSKTAAQTAATTATNKASEATTAAQTATTKAGEAQTSAQTASSKASEASQSASQASGYAQTAETAKTDAQTAKTQAETARDNAVTAKTAAETAQGKAEDAQAAAESVAESIPSDYSQLSEDVSDLKEELNAINVAPGWTWTYGKKIDASGNIFNSTVSAMSGKIEVEPGDFIKRFGVTTDSSAFPLLVDVNTYSDGVWQARYDLYTQGDTLTIGAGINSIVVTFSRTSASHVVMTEADINAYFNVAVYRQGALGIDLDKLSIKLENTIEQLSKYNSFDVIKLYRYENETKNGVSYTHNPDGTFTVSGTATSNSFHRIIVAQNDLPKWLEAGRSYYIKFSSGNVSLRIYEEINGTLSSSAISTQKDTVYKASESITGIQLRLFVSSGVTVNETISVSMLTGMPNELVDNPPMLTIIDDDANVKYYTQLLPLIERKGVPIVCALPAGKTYDDGVETHMSWEQIEDAYKRGAEFLNHSYSHWTYTVANEHTEQELWMDYTKAKNIIHSHGISGGDMFVYGGLSGTLAKAKKAATQMSKCAFHSHGDEINYRQTLDRWFIKRYGIEDAPYNYDISELKKLIDTCARRGGWMIWMIHTSDGEWTESIVDVLSEAIDYALAKGVAVVGAECGYIHYVS